MAKYYLIADKQIDREITLSYLLTVAMINYYITKPLL
jgi:hypothetical protein